MLDHFYRRYASQLPYNAALHDIVVNAPEDRPSVVVLAGLGTGAGLAYLGVEILRSGKAIGVHVVGEHAPERVAEILAELPGLAVREWRHPPGRPPKAMKDAPDAVWLDIGNGDNENYQAIMAWENALAPGGAIGGAHYDQSSVRRAVLLAFGMNEMRLDTRSAPIGKAWWRLLPEQVTA